MPRFRYAVKTLSPRGTTEYNGIEFVYNLPGQDETWSRPTIAPNQPDTPDGASCGAGGLHLHKTFKGEYRSLAQYWWLARYQEKDILGQDTEKIRVRQVQLRRISTKLLNLLIRQGYFKGADLRRAFLPDGNKYTASLDMKQFTR